MGGGLRSAGFQGTFLDQKKLVSYKIYFLLEYFSYRDITYLETSKLGQKIGPEILGSEQVGYPW